MTADDPTGEDARVRALLSSEPAEPMPDDVSERLETTLRAEVAARHESAPDADVPRIGRDRRVRRLLPSLAIAAIVLGVVAVALPRVLSGTGVDDSAGGSSTTSQGDAGTVAPEGSRASRGPGARERQPSLGSTAALAEPVALRRGEFADDVAARVVRADRSPGLVAAPSRDRLHCSSGHLLPAVGLAVTVDGAPARLFASGPARARAFEAIGCAGGSPRELATATLDTTGPDTTGR